MTTEEKRRDDKVWTIREVFHIFFWLRKADSDIGWIIAKSEVCDLGIIIDRNLSICSDMLSSI